MTSSFKAATDTRVKQLVHNLITYEAELPDTSKNFGIAFDFILSNLRQHSYPDAVFQQVWRVYVG
jgi:hypothetical protein